MNTSFALDGKQDKSALAVKAKPQVGDSLKTKTQRLKLGFRMASTIILLSHQKKLFKG